MVNFDTKAVIARIENRLIELGMSKDEFYEKSGISSASFSQWNTGKHLPTPKKLSAASRTLQVSAEYLMTGNKKTPAPKTEDGPSKEQREIMELYDALDDPADRAALLATARALVAARKSQGAR